MSRQWTVEPMGRNIVRLNITLEHVGDEQRVLLQSDVHWDNPYCQRDLFYEHLKQARAHDAPVLDNGDFFCAMQGKWDRRANKNDLRPEHQTARYLDALVSTAADDLAPYADLLTLRGQGNHERSILKKHETHLTERLVERLKVGGADSVVLGGYGGYVIFNILFAGGKKRSYKLHHFHGSGGGGPVTRGVIQTNRRAVYITDADFVWTGHVHESWDVEVTKLQLSHHCHAVEHRPQFHFSTPGYKEEYRDGHEGYHVEEGRAPKPIGARWLIFRFAKRLTVEADTMRAK